MLISLDKWNTNVRIERKFLVDKRGPFRLPTKNRAADLFYLEVTYQVYCP